MKLNIVPAKHGSLWVRQGIRAFWKQPLALSGLFFMFMTIMSLCSLIPYVGDFLALALMPAVSLGLMAATREVDLGKFPMPWILACAFRVGKERKREMLMLGVLYAGAFIGIIGLSTLIDGGDFAKLAMSNEAIDLHMDIRPEMQDAMLFTVVLNLLLSSVFWYAPALVHWNSVPAIKSLFFSTVAFLGNWRAFLVFGLMWAIVSSGTATAILLLGAVLDDFDFAASALIPAMLMISAMFFCSAYYSFKESFISDTLYA